MLDNSGSMSARLSGAVQIHYPVDVNVDNNGNIYVLEYWNNRIKKFDSSGNYITAFGGYGSNCNQWRNARQFDIKDNLIYISDTSNYRFVTLGLDGSCRTTRLVSHLRTSPIAMAVGGGWAWASGTDRIASHYTPSMYANPGQNVYSNEGGGSSFIWGMSWNNSGSRIAYANYSKNQVRIAYRSGHQLVAQNSPYASNRVRNCNDIIDLRIQHGIALAMFITLQYHVMLSTKSIQIHVVKLNWLVRIHPQVVLDILMVLKLIK